MALETKISEDIFGEIVDHKTKQKTQVKRYTMANDTTTIKVLNYGATIQSIEYADKFGDLDDIVLGFDDIEGYVSKTNQYFGAAIGRSANRTRDGKFSLDGKEYNLSKNDGENHLHGGNIGFDKVVWNSWIVEDKVVLTYLSQDGEEGYPGDLLVTLTYELSISNKLYIKFHAVSTKPTPVNLTNHSYFNLAGQGSGCKGVYEHDIMIKSDAITRLDDNSVPTGDLIDVEATLFDLRKPVNLGEMIKKRRQGYDNSFCVQPSGLAARASHPKSGRFMDVYVDEPCIQFYTGNRLPTAKGKKGTNFEKQGAFCLQSQWFPNSVNIPTFPNTIVRPGEQYKHTVAYCFGLL